MQNKKILAIDYGTKRIGIAISKASLAEPLTVLTNNEKIFEQIRDICVREQIDLIVLGISENKMAEKTRAFAKKLEQKLSAANLKIHLKFFDETLSSQTARKKLLAAKAKKSKRQAAIDHYAAALILEGWMEG
ncbi:MAG: Holliday junction resolvase RuvX [Candidatus Woesebacteria bacterium]|jgi:putative Holliday junction resolvase